MALSPETAVQKNPSGGLNCTDQSSYPGENSLITFWEKLLSYYPGLQKKKIHIQVLHFTFCSFKLSFTKCKVHIVQYWWGLVQSYSCCSCAFKGSRGCHHASVQTMESGHLNKRCWCVKPQRDKHTISGRLVACWMFVQYSLETFNVFFCVCVLCPVFPMH